MKILDLENTCLSCPSQWEAKTEDNRSVYIRYRWGFLRICVSEPGGSIDDAILTGTEIYGEQLGDDYHGYMDESELLPILEALPEISQLKGLP